MTMLAEPSGSSQGQGWAPACRILRVWLPAVTTLRRALLAIFIISWDDLGFRRNACMILTCFLLKTITIVWCSFLH